MGPCREVGVPSAGANISLYHNVGCRVAPGILGIPANEVLGMLGDPRVVRRHMVGHEIEEQLHAPLRQFLPGNGKTFRTSEVLVNHVASYAIGRSYVVLGTKIRECAPEVVNQVLVLIGNGDARRTSLPNAHQPDGIETKGSNGIPFG